MPPQGDPQSALGEAIRELRVEAGMTQEDLAHRAGITTGTLSLIERGQSNPTWATVRAIARALDVPLIAVAERVERREGPR